MTCFWNADEDANQASLTPVRKELRSISLCEFIYCSLEAPRARFQGMNISLNNVGNPKKWGHLNINTHI